MSQRNADLELRDAMAALAAEELPGLIEEARAEARQRARALLADALTEALLDRAKTHADDAARPERQPNSRPTDLAYYVYCVVKHGAEIPADLAGIAPEHPPAIILDGNLAAVVSKVPLEDFEDDRLREQLNDMEWLERAARTHEQVLDAVGRETTLVPMRLCSVYRTESGVIDMLEREADALTTALEQLHGKQEWGVKVFATTPSKPVASEILDASGTDYMQRRQGERDERQQVTGQLFALGRSIHERLARFAADAVVSPPQRPELSGHDGQMLLNGVYLVDEGDRDAFLELVEYIRQEHDADGLELEPTGPWPAYNFVPNSIGAAS